LPPFAIRTVAKACFAGRKQIFAFADRTNAATRCISSAERGIGNGKKGDEFGSTQLHGNLLLALSRPVLKSDRYQYRRFRFLYHFLR
jgi:hypothetical protein